MKILLTGTTGYIGKRLLPALIAEGYEIVCCVRERQRFSPPLSLQKHIQVIEVDFLDKRSLENIPEGIQGAYYLMHSMSSSLNYEQLERDCSINFRERMDALKVKHVVYLSGITNEKYLSRHLSSRKMVEEELAKGNYHLTTLRSGIIIGSGSASFEIIRDLVEKLPVMITPKWLETKCQPIAIQDVIALLTKSLLNRKIYGQSHDIGGPDIISYKEMLLGYAKARGLKRFIFVVPVMTPKLSSYWLYFVTSVSYRLAAALVSSMKVEVICRENTLPRILGIPSTPYEEALKRTLLKIEENQVVSSWQDSWVSGRIQKNVSDFLHIPVHGCYIDRRIQRVTDVKACVEKIWSIGGQTGWYSVNILWRLRGFLDKMFGGVGMRGGRTHLHEIAVGDAVDFWRVLYADKAEARLLLFAEMKLPGEAWLEFKVKSGYLEQTATFRPKGLLGRLYWYSVLPFHGIIFRKMLTKLASAS